MNFLRNVIGAIVGWFFPAIVWQIPPGLTADQGSMYGMFQALSLLNDYCYVLVNITAAVSMSLTAQQMTQFGLCNINGAVGGAITLTVDTAVNILAGMSPNFIGLPTNSTYGSPLRIVNNGTTQTITMNANTGVTILGLNTIANNAWREFLMIPTGPTTVTLFNMGGGTL